MSATRILSGLVADGVPSTRSLTRTARLEIANCALSRAGGGKCPAKESASRSGEPSHALHSPTPPAGGVGVGQRQLLLPLPLHLPMPLHRAPRPQHVGIGGTQDVGPRDIPVMPRGSGEIAQRGRSGRIRRIDYPSSRCGRGMLRRIRAARVIAAVCAEPGPPHSRSTGRSPGSVLPHCGRERLARAPGEHRAFCRPTVPPQAGARSTRLLARSAACSGWGGVRLVIAG